MLLSDDQGPTVFVTPTGHKFLCFIRPLRVRMKLTQRELAKEMRVTRQTVIALESGSASPSLRNLFALSAALDSHIPDIYQPLSD
jgi:putative transcriptional regulator